MATDLTPIGRLRGGLAAAVLLAAVGCGGPPPPPDPYHLAGAKDSLSQGNHWYGRGCYEEAERYFAEGLDFARLSDQARLLVRAQNSLGAAALARGETDLAAARLERALELCRSQAGEPELDKILANLGALAFKLGRLDDADNFWAEALEAARSRGQNPAPQLCDLARLRLAQNRRTEFLDLTAQALAAAENTGPAPGTPGVTALTKPSPDRPGTEPLPDTSVRADALNLAGQAALLEDRPAEAESFFLRALELDRRTENTLGLAQDTESLGQLMLRLERYREAAGYLDRSFFLWLAVGDDQRAGPALAALRQLSQTRGFPRDLSIYQEALRRPEPYRLTRQCP